MLYMRYETKDNITYVVYRGEAKIAEMVITATKGRPLKPDELRGMEAFAYMTGKGQGRVHKLK